MTPAPPVRRGRRACGALAAAALATLLSACAVDPLPAPRPAAEDSVTPVLGGDQLDAVLEPVATALAAGDASLSYRDLEPAVAGPALEQRAGAYLMQTRVPESTYTLPLGTERLQDLVPAEQDWPRTVLTVTRASADDQFPDLVLLTQAGPRDPYVLTAYAPMLPGVTLPITAPLREGVPVPPVDEQGDLLMSPADAATQYADVLSAGEASPFAESFADDTFSAQVVAVQDAERAALSTTCAGCFTYSADHVVRDGQTWAFGTEEGGAVVLTVLTGANALRVAAEGSRATLNPEYAALAGAETATQGADFSYVEVVGLHVPPASAGAPVEVLAAQRVPLSGTAL